MSKQNNERPDLCYLVLTPIKFQGMVIKPPRFMQLTAEEAEPMIAAGLIAADAALSLEEAATASIDTVTRHHATTSEAKPAGGAPPAGAARKHRVAKKAVKRS